MAPSKDKDLSLAGAGRFWCAIEGFACGYTTRINNTLRVVTSTLLADDLSAPSNSRRLFQTAWRTHNYLHTGRPNMISTDQHFGRR